MKAVQIIGAIVIFALVAFVSAPLWGGCDLNEDLCQTWCDVRYSDSAIQKGTCKASCVTDRLGCLAK